MEPADILLQKLGPVFPLDVLISPKSLVNCQHKPRWQVAVVMQQQCVLPVRPLLQRHGIPGSNFLPFCWKENQGFCCSGGAVETSWNDHVICSMSQKRCFFKAFFKLRCASACSNPPTYRWGHNIGLCLIMQPTSHMHVLKESPEQLHNTPLGMNRVFNTNTEKRVISAVSGTHSTWAFIVRFNATDGTSWFLRGKSCQICLWDMP